MRQKLNIITLGVKNLPSTIEFYKKGLGWKPSAKGTEDLILFPLGGITIAFYPLVALAEDTTLPYEASSFSGITLAYNAKSIKEVDEVMQKVKTLGATIVKPAQKVFWGGYSGYYKDLDGYLFEVAFNPFWELDEADNLIL